MTNSASDALQSLNARIQAILPAQYRECYEDVSPTSMGSASLIFGADGRVAWDRIWTHFCDLALAGGPPHRAKLLQPCSSAEMYAEEGQYQEVVSELGRGIFLTTRLPVLLRPAPGWVGVRCESDAMAGWLLRAVTAENVQARQDGVMLYLPAGPRFRVEKEIKNVIVALAKTCHYWLGHMPAEQRESIAAIFRAARAATVQASTPEEVQAAPERYASAVCDMENALRAMGLELAHDSSPGWLGVVCTSQVMAAWLMRALIAQHVLARRENTVLCLPVEFYASRREESSLAVGTLFQALHLWQTHPARSEN